MARLATSAAHFCQRLQELYPQKLAITTKHQSEQSSPFRRWTTGSGAGSSYRHHDHRNMYNKQMSEGTAPVSSTNGSSSNVARWSLGLEQLLADPSGAAAFAHFLAKEFAAENIRFWWSCEKYRSIEDGSQRAALAQEIWQRHLDEKASEPVNVDAAARRAAALVLYHDPPPPDLFAQAQKQIFNVMKFDSYPRFLRSAEHAECARAGLRGAPLPYADTNTNTNTNNSNREQDSSPNKLKKSASNASERRRSGGASLLPWKMRTSSRDRLNEPPVTDVVKSSQVAPGQALCRVVLPDGATSVVGVDPTVSVQSLVQRLLQRRNLDCSTYDVLLKDPEQKEATTIEVSSPSTVLSGRCVAVERRVVVRVEVRGRVVAVRCRASRALRHVLRPVLARYCGAAPAAPALAPAVLSAGRLLHPDTIMQELDGCRLQVVESPNEARVEPREREREREPDSDADSMSDVALRLQDDRDLISQSSSTSSSRSSAPLTPGAPGLPAPCDPCAAGPAVPTAGRVRAALRPGPPLHLHPDFLDNLRETQRQRLHPRDSPPAPPAPRTPPPLPPKPLRAHPTVV